MKTPRLMLLLASIAVCVSLLTGCHGAKKSDAFEVPDHFDLTKSYEISFWSKNDTNITQTRIYEKAIEDFEKIYPNIKVNLKQYTDYGKIYNDVITNIPTQTTPNVCITYPDHIATYITGDNTVVELDKLALDEKYGLGGREVQFESVGYDEIVPEHLEECVIGDRLYALPFMRSTEACYVNKTYVEKLGYTLPETLSWDFVFEVAQAATEKDENGIYKVNGQKVMIPFIYKSTDNMMIQMLKQKNAGYSNELGDILIFNDTTSHLLSMISEYARTGAFSTFKISSYPANFLNAGQCIFAIDSTAGATWMGSDAPLSDISEDKLVSFETAVMPIPQFENGTPIMISQGPSLCIFNKEDPGEVLASWLFMQYLLTNEVQIAYSQTEGYVPVTERARQSEEYIDYLSREGEDNALYYSVKLKATKLLIDNTENTFVTPVFNGSASLRNAAGQLVEEVTKSARRKENIDNSYMEKLYDEITSLYRLDNNSRMQGTRVELGRMPIMSVLVICILAFTWVCIALYVLVGKIKNRKI